MTKDYSIIVFSTGNKVPAHEVTEEHLALDNFEPLEVTEQHIIHPNGHWTIAAAHRHAKRQGMTLVRLVYVSGLSGAKITVLDK